MSTFRLCNTRAIQAENPYRSLVGEGWDEVAPGVRAALSPPLAASGRLLVRHARRGIGRLIVRLIQLPPEGEYEVRLEVTPDAEGVRWIRQFGALRAVSVQTFGGGNYVEEARPFRMVLRIDREGSSLVHRQVGTKILGVPAPIFLGPMVVGIMSEGPDERSWRLAVDIRHCWFGSICHYEGVMRLE